MLDDDSLVAARRTRPYLIRLFLTHVWPFGMFQDASRGSRLARIAAYRHNRRMRHILPEYLKKWLIGCAIALVIMSGCDAVARDAASQPSLFIWFAAAFGTLFAVGLCIMSVTAYIYLYLSYNDH